MKLFAAICCALIATLPGPAVSGQRPSAPAPAPSAAAAASAPAPPAGAKDFSTTDMQQTLGLPKYALEQCRAGRGFFCDFLSGLLYTADKSRLPEAFSADLKLEELSARAFQADCDADDVYGCFQAGMKLKSQGQDPAAGKFQRAVKVCEQACAKQIWPGCLLPLAISKSSDTSPGGDAKRAAYLRRACEGGFAPACQHPAPDAFFTAMNSGAGLGQMGAASLLWLCEQGPAAHCALLGWSEFTGMPGVKEDRAAALRHFHMACDKGDGMGCQMAGVAHRFGMGTEKNPAEAVRGFTRACELKLGYACFNLGADLLDPATRRPTDPAKAFKLLTAACDGDNGAGCGLLAKLHQNGDGTARDPEKARALLRKACQLKYAPACQPAAKQP